MMRRKSVECCRAAKQEHQQSKCFQGIHDFDRVDKKSSGQKGFGGY